MKPIIFSAPMVRAILSGSKSQTRRVMNPEPTIDADGMWHWKDCQWMDGGLGFPPSGIEDYAPHKVNDELWVRETWRVHSADEGTCSYEYFADDVNNGGGTWKPSIFMPPYAARIFLRVTGIRLQRLQNITEEDALAEGVWNLRQTENEPPIEIFSRLWDMLNGNKEGHTWARNPWVWVYTFERNPWLWVYTFERIPS